MENKVVFFWFRRDLRLEDNTALNEALAFGLPVIPLFVFDDAITATLPQNDARLTFIYDSLSQIHQRLRQWGSGLLVRQGTPLMVWQFLITTYNIAQVYFNHDYEPYARERDRVVYDLLRQKGIPCKTFKDQVIFAPDQVLKKDGNPYTVYTPYKNRWLQQFYEQPLPVVEPMPKQPNLSKLTIPFPTLADLGFVRSHIRVKPYDLSRLSDYDAMRDFPAEDSTSYLAPYLRFGLVSIRHIVVFAVKTNAVFLSELIWREFFMQILYHYPHIVNACFKPKYEAVPWRDAPKDFERWCQGNTGYPLVDAGMRQLNETGYMHNRVRMVVAGFLCKHLLIDWRLGEAYFAKKLLDFELASNNGNWQWAAGTGCDAAPYFRVFNPTAQREKFDKDWLYTKKWVRDLDLPTYPVPMVEHRLARQRTIDTYKKAFIDSISKCNILETNIGEH